jgi:hypothetical protein
VVLPVCFGNSLLNRKDGIGVEADADIVIRYREEAKAHFSRNPGFKAWDPEVLDLYVQYALVDIPRSEGGGVRLKMSGFQVCSMTLLRECCVKMLFYLLRKRPIVQAVDSFKKLTSTWADWMRK